MNKNRFLKIASMIAEKLEIFKTDDFYGNGICIALDELYRDNCIINRERTSFINYMIQSVIDSDKIWSWKDYREFDQKEYISIAQFMDNYCFLTIDSVRDKMKTMFLWDKNDVDIRMKWIKEQISLVENLTEIEFEKHFYSYKPKVIESCSICGEQNPPEKGCSICKQE